MFAILKCVNTLRTYTKLFVHKMSTKKAPTLLLFVVVMTLFFAMRNGGNAITVFSFDDFGILEKIKLFFSVLYDVQNTFSLYSFLLLILISFLQSSIIILFYSYMKKRNEALRIEKASILVSTILAMFGTSCAACGGAALTLLSSFGLFGVGALASPFNSTAILFVVFLFLLFSLFRLLKKVENPFVC